jgi:hypothetical protein
VTRLAWVLCLLAVVLAAASVPLAAFNGEDLGELVTNHHAIGILTALVLAPVGALIVVGDRRHLLAWLLLGNSLTLAAYNFSEQYAPLALGLTPARLSLPGGELASWLTSWTTCPASSSRWCSWCCCSPTGGCRRAAGGRSGWPAP